MSYSNFCGSGSGSEAREPHKKFRPGLPGMGRQADSFSGARVFAQPWNLPKPQMAWRWEDTHEQQLTKLKAGHEKVSTDLH